MQEFWGKPRILCEAPHVERILGLSQKQTWDWTRPGPGPPGLAVGAGLASDKEAVGGRPLKLRWRYPEKQQMRGEDCNPGGGPRGGRLMESWGPVAVVLIDPWPSGPSCSSNTPTPSLPPGLGSLWV